MSFKPISLSNVYNFYRILGDKIDIIGSGGVNTGMDVFEYILCGAKCVQIGACMLREGTHCFKRIENELYEIMKAKGYSHIEDFRGKLGICKA
jgi:dihydroorotate dehydrogenase (fumarate)